MKIRLRRLSEDELVHADRDGYPLVIPLQRANHPTEITYVVLEYALRELSTDVWYPVEVE